MDEQNNDTSTRPLEEKPTVKKPVLDKKSVNRVFFLLITCGLLLVGSLAILAIWDYVSKDVAWKAFSTLLVLMAAAAVFSFINERLGDDV